jgi:hypothetical protein
MRKAITVALVFVSCIEKGRLFRPSKPHHQTPCQLINSSSSITSTMMRRQFRPSLEVSLNFRRLLAVERRY